VLSVRDCGGRGGSALVIKHIRWELSPSNDHSTHRVFGSKKRLNRGPVTVMGLIKRASDVWGMDYWS
jgi:hypothetical protein